ncbi:MAG: chromate resistance protein ChrB domain-containing protein [Gemmatimonadales bacterium]
MRPTTAAPTPLKTAFTYEGDRCTFEVLVARFCPGDRVLGRLAKGIHDIDCKDAKFKRRETARVRRRLDTLINSTSSDRVRLRKGAAIFDSLYAEPRRTPSVGPRRRNA